MPVAAANPRQTRLCKHVYAGQHLAILGVEQEDVNRTLPTIPVLDMSRVRQGRGFHHLYALVILAPTYLVLAEPRDLHEARATTDAPPLGKDSARHARSRRSDSVDFRPVTHIERFERRYVQSLKGDSKTTWFSA